MGEQWSLATLAMKTFLHVLALATCVACVTANPARKGSESDEDGSGDGPEIVINDAVTKNVEANEVDNAAESASNPEDLLGMEMNPEDNEIKDNEKIEQDVTNVSKKKCQKCIRSHYRARHADFCDVCEKKNDNGEMKNDEASQVSKPNKRCAKCARKNFKARNEVFCSEECPSSEETKDHTKAHNKKENNKKNKIKDNKDEDEEEEIVEAESDSTNPDVTDETTTEQNSKIHEKKNNEKKKNQKHKNKKKNKKQADKKVDETKLEDAESVPEVEEEEKDKVKLGPLESLIRFLIKSNTYSH